MSVKITVNENNSIKLEWNEKKIYIDPYKIKEDINDADYVFVTHSHFDHFSVEDIQKVIKKETKIITTESTYNEQKDEIRKFENCVVLIIPEREYLLDNIKFRTVRAYNIDKNFHPKENDYCGYILELDDEKYYICGDTDYIPEMNNIKADYIFVPIGGTYTMDRIQASEMVNHLKPKVAIPVHYGSVVGKKEDAIIFKENLNEGIECRILID